LLFDRFQQRLLDDPRKVDLVAKRGVNLKPSQQGQVSPEALDVIGGKQRG
jgi:hypothetical protein